MWQRRNKRSNDPEDGKGRHEGEKDQDFNFTREITYESVEKTESRCSDNASLLPYPV